MKVPTPLIGCEVTRTSFDYQVRLLLVAFDPEGYRAEGYRVAAELVIETPFLLADATGTWHELDPGTGATLAPVLDLFRHTIRTVKIRGKGALHLAFDNGAELHIDPDPRYESWSLNGTGVDPILVGPGGETNWQQPADVEVRTPD